MQQAREGSEQYDGNPTAEAVRKGQRRSQQWLKLLEAAVLQRPGRRPSTQKPCARRGGCSWHLAAGASVAVGGAPFLDSRLNTPTPRALPLGSRHGALGEPSPKNQAQECPEQLHRPGSCRHRAATRQGRPWHCPAMPHRTASRKPVPGVSPEHRGATEWSEDTDTPTDIAEEAPAQAGGGGCHCSGSCGGIQVL